jgi:hypothetical protein
MAWLLSVTFTAGVQRSGTRPRIGFLAQAAGLNEKFPALDQALSAARATGDVMAIETAAKALRTNRTLRFNNLLDAFVAGTFLALVSVIVLLSLREWFVLLSRRKPAVLRETDQSGCLTMRWRKVGGVSAASRMRSASSPSRRNFPAKPLERAASGYTSALATRATPVKNG